MKTKNVILCRSGPRITMNLKLNMRFSINHFLTIVRPPSCTAKCVLSCADISYSISGLVAVDRRSNAASKKENNTMGIPIHFPIRCFLKNNPSTLAHNTDGKNQAVKVLFVTATVDLVVQLDLWVSKWETYLEPCQFSKWIWYSS